MNAHITTFFAKQLRKLKRRFRSVEDDVAHELKLFSPETTIALGDDFFKIRVANSDIPCGKSGGYRVIVYFSRAKETIVPLRIYSKRDYAIITPEEIQAAFRVVCDEIGSDI